MNNEFELLEERILVEQKNTRARLFKHKKTGAQLLSCCNNDENKVFGVTFRTPPKDSTGVAHILEHSVLCGSQKYPIKEPFVELLKSSLQTFLNAFTYPDKTCYPVASTNTKDFYNLIDVYLDAVFHPLISEDTLKQEGWHLGASSMEEPVFFKGVVYNEMKGVYSSADSLLAEKVQHSLFPTTTYSVDSGGEPTHILELTYSDFLDFHTQYYHPSNARFFFWGDDDEETRLATIATLLSEYTALDIDSSINLQKAFSEPHYIEHKYESSLDEHATFVTCNFLLPETIHAELVFAFEILEYILLGMPGAPLRKALIESGLGTDTTGGGLHTDLRQMYFSIGLKGVAKENIQAVEECIFKTIEDLVHNGIPDNLLEAAFTSIEFELRENNTSRFPVGLAQMVRCLTTWLYDASPFILMEYEKTLTNVKNKPKEYFTILLQTYFLNNPSRTRVVLIPDTELQSQRIAKEKEKIEHIEASLSKEDKEKLVEETKEFIQRQSVPDTAEALSRIPKLSLDDIDKKEKDIPLHIQNNFFFAPLPTSGIAYIDMYFSLQQLPQKSYPLLSLYARALLEMGTQSKDYSQLGIEISCSLGDIDFSPTFFITSDTKKVSPYFVLECKALYSKLEQAQPIILDILHNPNFSNKERLLQILLEEKARIEQSILPSGHSVVLTRMAYYQTQIGQLEEITSGIEYLAYLRTLEARIHNDFESLSHELEYMHKVIFNKNNIYINAVCEDHYEEKIQQYTNGLIDTLISNEAIDEPIVYAPYKKVREAFIMQSQVNYMSKGLSMYEHGIEYHPSFAVACKYLRMGYLWEQVRIQGGAYGAFVLCNQYTGLLSFASYRDPNIQRTLEVFDNAGKHIESHTFSKQEIESLCIATLGDRDMYLLPDAKGRLAFTRYMMNNTLEKRQYERDIIFSTTEKDIQRIGAALQILATKGSVVALGGTNLQEYAKEHQYTLHTIDSYE